MVRLCLTAEGYTEQRFALDLLVPHLARYGVYLLKPRLTSLGKKKGHIHRGGLRSYTPVKNDIRRWLKQDQAADVHFTTMIDLYGLPSDFPEYAEARKAPDPYARVARLEAGLQHDLGDPRFIPYIQLHEFEALLLSNPEAFVSRYPQHVREIDRLMQLCSAFKSPELIDDGEHTAPSKRIEREIPEYTRAKPTAGPMLAAEIGLDVIRAKCPHFNDWLVKLETLEST